MADESVPKGKYGLRYEDMTEEELEYYREFWQEPAPDPQFVVTSHSSATARVRMLTGLSFTVLLLGLLAALTPLILGHLWWALPGLAVAVLALVVLLLTRRRYFRWLRPDGEAPLPRPTSRWLWLPHLMTLVGVLAAVAGSTVVPEIYADAEDTLRRNYVLLWQESGMFLVLLGALAYGLITLSLYTAEDLDESIIRPTDYAEKQREKDRTRGRRDDDFYDSNWLSGR